MRSVFAPFGPLTDQQWRHLAEHSSRRYDDGSLGASYDPAIGNAFTGAMQDVVLWPVWDGVSCPTLVLRGKQSDLLLRDTPVMSRGAEGALVD
jgi:hypothetical protein